jgi:hypothetical protein
MLRQLIATSALIFATAPLLISMPAIATPKVATANQALCQNTIKAVSSQLRLVKSVKMRPIGNFYGKYPQGRSMAAGFKIVNNNPRSEDLINDAAKLSAASKKIAASCTYVGMIEFYIDQTNHGFVYGMINGQIKQFTCNNETPMKWGEVMCP